MDAQEINDMITILVDKWLTHCKEQANKKHIPVTEGGKATYQYFPATGRVFCCVKGCDWRAKFID